MFSILVIEAMKRKERNGKQVCDSIATQFMSRQYSDRPSCCSDMRKRSREIHSGEKKHNGIQLLTGSVTRQPRLAATEISGATKQKSSLPESLASGGGFPFPD